MKDADITHVKNHHQRFQLLKYGQVPNRKIIMKISRPYRNISSVVLIANIPSVHSTKDTMGELRGEKKNGKQKKKEVQSISWRK